MVTWQRLVEKADGELAMLDIAEVNLLCGEGLPGLDEPELGKAIGTIDHWAYSTRAFTERVMQMFHSGESDYPDSEPRFRIQAMITHLQRDLGIRYRHDRRQDEATFEPADSFLNGILLGKGGTCASLPVLYAAIGRRLGYPLMLCRVVIVFNSASYGPGVDERFRGTLRDTIEKIRPQFDCVEILLLPGDGGGKIDPPIAGYICVDKNGKLMHCPPKVPK